jgi:hypothetical protein
MLGAAARARAAPARACRSAPPRVRVRVRAAAGQQHPGPRKDDSLAALERLCASPEQLPDECATPAPAALPGEPAPVTRSVELLLPDDAGGVKPVALSLRVRDPASRLLVAALQLPLGLVFEERDARVELVEVLPEGSAANAGPDVPRLRPGDTLRAVTACVTAMEYGALNLLGGGVGRPRTRAVVVRVDEAETWSDASFGRALAAVQSNARAGRRAVTLVLERGEDT